MGESTLSQDQIQIIEAPLGAKIFLEGPAGCGKTTVGVERMLYLMARGVPGGQILVLLPQRTLGEPYLQALRHPGVLAGSMVSLLTVGGLAQRMVDLFWPLVAGEAGFAYPDDLPVFLTLETAQYYMAHLVRPLLDEGLFDSVTIDRNRLYSQILDNLNKAAVAGFAYTEIGERLKQAWVGEAGQLRVYDDVQACASRFREYCLAHNLLDFSLQLEVFWKYLWPLPACRQYLQGTYRHLVYDNLEEDTPVSHDLVGEWLPDLDSALLIYDQGAGLRLFLGADPHNARQLKDLCPEQAVLEDSFVTAPQVARLARGLESRLQPGTASQAPAAAKEEPAATEVRSALAFEAQRFYPQMLDWVADRIAELVHGERVPPDEIVVLAPFLSDALRFSLATRLEARQVPARSHRPSRSLREESATQCLLTLAALAHPGWWQPTRYDVAYALVQAIDGLDLVRAQLLAEIVYREKESPPSLASFEAIKPIAQERITFRLGGRYEHLRLWLEDYRQGAPEAFDHFLSRLFGELLSQPGYGFHASFDAGRVTANLIESVQKFRWVAGPVLDAEGMPLGQEYIEMVRQGVIAAQYVQSWQTQPDGAVLLAPAYTFLMSNRPVDYQFWLDVGSRGWFERLYQPLTHPYVLSRRWTPGRVWTDLDEVQASQEALQRLVLGLLRRCRWKVYLGLSEYSEQGYEQRGPLLKAFWRLLRQEVGLE
jgi:superfamily I DNA/RNA helicase